MYFKMSSAICFNLDQSKILSFRLRDSMKEINKVYLKIVIRNTHIKFHRIWSSGQGEIDPNKQTDEQTNDGRAHVVVAPQPVFLK